MHIVNSIIEVEARGITSTFSPLIDPIFNRGENQMTRTTIPKLCSFAGCDRKHSAKGYCDAHYASWRRHGEALPFQVKHIGCSIEGCDRKHHTHGYCQRHWGNLSRYGHAIPKREWTTTERLNDIGWTVTDTGCWEWKGARNDLGYGLLRGERVHRLTYVHLGGNKLRSDQVLRHKCDNPPCVNPDHLIPGIQADNVQDMMERGRHYRQSQTHCKHGHDFREPGNMRITTHRNRNERVCVPCARERNRRYEIRQRAAIGL